MLWEMDVLPGASSSVCWTWDMKQQASLAEPASPEPWKIYHTQALWVILHFFPWKGHDLGFSASPSLSIEVLLLSPLAGRNLIKWSWGVNPFSGLSRNMPTIIPLTMNPSALGCYSLSVSHLDGCFIICNAAGNGMDHHKEIITWTTTHELVPDTISGPGDRVMNWEKSFLSLSRQNILMKHYTFISFALVDSENFALTSFWKYEGMEEGESRAPPWFPV